MWGENIKDVMLRRGKKQELNLILYIEFWQGQVRQQRKQNNVIKRGVDKQKEEKRLSQKGGITRSNCHVPSLLRLGTKKSQHQHDAF